MNAMKTNDCEYQDNPQTQLKQDITADNFWETDLDVIEASFLPEGVKITDLPVKSAYFN